MRAIDAINIFSKELRMSERKSLFQQFLETYNGKKLLEKHSLKETGVWKIEGEDPNCDFGGHHYSPDLGTYEGMLEDIISLAVDIPSFWTWGAGGTITRLNPPIKVDSNTTAKIAELKRNIAYHEERLQEAKNELKNLGVQ